MIRDDDHAKAVRKRRAEAGKSGVPKAVRRFYKRLARSGRAGSRP